MTVRGVILAAGMGRRMGTIKQLLPLHGKPLLQHVLDAARASRLDHLTLVLGHAHETIRLQLETTGISLVINENFAQGQSTSLHAGLVHGPDTAGVMFLLGDQPLVEPPLINTLIDAFATTKALAVVPMYQNLPGNPVILGRKLICKALNLRGDTGARPLLQYQAPEVHQVEVNNPRVFFDVDTPEAYQTLLGLHPQN